MTDFKYRVHNESTGSVYAGTARLSEALIVYNLMRAEFPEVTIDEIVSTPSIRTPIVGDTVRTGSVSAGGGHRPGQMGELLEIDDADTSWPYRVRVDGDSYGAWFSSVEPG